MDIHYYRQLEAICQHASTALFMMDKRQRCTYMNPAAERLSGYTLAEIRKHPLHDIFHQSHRGDTHSCSPDSCPLRQSPMKQSQCEGREVFVHKDGHSYNVAYTISTLNEDEEVTGAVMEVRDITEQTRIQAALWASEERHRLMSLATNDVIWDWDLASNHIDWNEATWTHLGYSPQELESGAEDWYQRIHPEDAERTIASIHSAIDSGEQSWQAEYRFRKKDGSYAVFLDRGYIARDESGRPYRMIGSMLNRTEHRRAEEALRRTADADAFRVKLNDAIRPHVDPVEIQKAVTRLLGQHLNASRVHYAEIRKDGAHCVVYADYCKDLPSMVGRHHLDDYGVKVMNSFRSGHTLVIGDVNCHPDLSASERNETAALGVCAYVMVPLIKGGRAVAAFAVHQSRPRHWSDAEVALIEETADRTWAAVERAHAEESLRASEQRFRLLTDGIPHMVWLSDPKGHFDFLSRQFTAYTGLPGKPIHAEQLTPKVVHPDDVAQTIDAWRDALRQCRTFIAEHRIRSAQGEYRWFLSRAEPQMDENNGRILRWFGTTTDIHDQKVAEETLRKADRQKDEFLAMLAHELRNPLAAVRNVGQLLETAIGDESGARGYLQILQRQTGTLTELVEELLDVSRITRGLVELKKERVNLAEVASHALESVQPLLDQKRHKVNVNIPLQPLEVMGDKVRLEQILVNLLTNAAKYTDPGGQVSLVLATRNGQVEVRISDTGIGMTQEVIEHSFTLFGQAERGLDRAQGGLGIGLTIAKNLAEMHRGFIEAHSEGLGKGAEFVVTLPLAPAAQPGAGAEPAAETRPARSKRVLLVEDSVDVAETLAMLLENSGHQVTVVHDGHSALAKVEEIDPELILLDIGLPEMDGYELARRLRQMPGMRTKVIAALTGYGQPSDRARAEAAGFDAHFIKPVNWHTLQSFVAESEARPGNRV